MPRLSLPAIALRGLTARPLRGLALAAALAMLSALVAFAVVFVSSVNNAIRSTTDRLGADIVLVPVGALERAEEFLLESRKKVFYMDGGVLAKVRRIKGVAAATPQIYLRTLRSGCCSVIEGQVVVFDPESDFVISPWLAGGRMPEPGEVAVGSYVHEYLGLIDTPSLFGRKMKVSGHLRRTGTGLDNGIFMRAEDLAAITPKARGEYRPGMVSIVFVRIAKGEDADTVAARIQSEIFDAGVLTRGSIGRGLAAVLADMVRIFSITILVSAVLTTLLAWSAFAAMTAEKRREVGIFRALGATRTQVLGIFLFEAALYAATGGVCGAAAGIAIAGGLVSGFNLVRETGAPPVAAATYALATAAAISCAAAVCFTGAAAPVARLSRMDAGQALQER